LQKLVGDAFGFLGRGELTSKAFASFEGQFPIHAMVCSLIIVAKLFSGQTRSLQVGRPLSGFALPALQDAR